jgi:hypothetical protein
MKNILKNTGWLYSDSSSIDFQFGRPLNDGGFSEHHDILFGFYFHLWPLRKSNEPWQRSGYNHWLRAGRQRDRSSSPDRVTNFFSSILPIIQWLSEALSEGTRRQGREAKHPPPTSAEGEKICIDMSTFPYDSMAYGLVS